jgi:hypothetical protein
VTCVNSGASRKLSENGASDDIEEGTACADRVPPVLKRQGKHSAFLSREALCVMTGQKER